MLEGVDFKDEVVDGGEAAAISLGRTAALISQAGEVWAKTSVEVRSWRHRSLQKLDKQKRGWEEQG